MVLDLVTQPTSHILAPRTVVWAKRSSGFSKTDDLIRGGVVTCGNRAIAEHVIGLGGKARIIPTVVEQTSSAD